MNDIRKLGALLLSTVLALPGAATAQSNVGGAVTDVKNEKVVRETYQRFVEAWNRHDFQALANMYSIDGDHIEPDGDHADGRADVGLLLKRQHEGVFKKTHLMLNIADIWFITREVALVDGGYAISGIQAPNGKEIPERRGHITAVLLFEDGKWWIVASRLMAPTELPYKP